MGGKNLEKKDFWHFENTLENEMEMMIP